VLNNTRLQRGVSAIKILGFAGGFPFGVTIFILVMAQMNNQPVQVCFLVISILEI